MTQKLASKCRYHIITLLTVCDSDTNTVNTQHQEKVNSDTLKRDCSAFPTLDRERFLTHVPTIITKTLIRNSSPTQYNDIRNRNTKSYSAQQDGFILKILITYLFK